MPKLLFSFIILIMFSLTSCVDFYSNSVSQIETIETVSAKQYPQPGRVYTLRGLWGVLSFGVNDFTKNINHQLGIRAVSLAYTRGDYLQNALIRHAREHRLQHPLIIIGHSFGADEAIKIAAQLNKAHTPIELLITLDGVFQHSIPPNVAHVINIYISNPLQGLRGLRGYPVVALAPSKTQVENYDLSRGQPFAIHGTNHFNILSNKEIQTWLMGVMASNLSVK